MSWYVYALTCQTTGVIRYIGVSSNPRARLKMHTSASAAPAIREWVKNIGDPGLVVLGEYPIEDDALQSERELIAKHRRTLLNMTEGGEMPSRRSLKFSGFGARLKMAREAYGVSARELAKRCGLSAPAITRAENGSSKHMEAETAVLIARALHTTVEYLVTGEGSP